MKNKLIASLLCGLLAIGVFPIGVSAEWIQNSDSSWSWTENGFNSYGWKQINGSWYYFNNGKMQTGWLNVGYNYYLGNDGSMKTGWVSIDGAWYYFNTSGMLATDTVVDGYYVDSKGIMQPKEKQKVLLDNKYVKITYLGVDKNSNYFKKVSLQVENKSSQELIVQTDKVSIDDCMVYGMFSPDIMPGKIDTKGITFNSSSITTGFNSIQGEFKIIDKNYKTLDTEDFSIQF